MVAKLILKLLAILLSLYTSSMAPAGTSIKDQTTKDMFLARIILSEIQNHDQNGSPTATAPFRRALPTMPANPASPSVCTTQWEGQGDMMELRSSSPGILTGRTRQNQAEK